MPKSSYPRSIYIHLPFCKTKCPYCDFVIYRKESRYPRTYLEALYNEINFFFKKHKISKEDTNINGIFGGGTPSIHSAKQLTILEQLKSRYFDENIEITMEANLEP